MKSLGGRLREPEKAKGEGVHLGLDKKENGETDPPFPRAGAGQCISAHSARRWYLDQITLRGSCSGRLCLGRGGARLEKITLTFFKGTLF